MTQNNGPRCFHDVFYDNDDEDVSENLALHIACENGHFDVVKLLLDYLSENPGATHINLKNDDDGYTPLMIACEKKETEIVKLLLEQDDLEVNLQDNAGKTAFYHACLNLSSECAKLLLQHPSIEIKSSRERLPLHGFALEWDDAFGINPLSEWTKMFEFLCSLPDIDINDRDDMGRTVLHCACVNETDNPQLVEKILQQPNIDINAEDDNGDTALRLAVKRQNFEIIQEIVSYGVEKGIKPNVV